MSTPLIDDSLVEMVAKIIDHDAWAAIDDGRDARPDSMWDMRRGFAIDKARFALAVASPVIAGKCAEVARDTVIVNRKAAMSYADGSRGKVRLLDEANAAASIERAIRSLTKDTQS